ncbi:hypothetical protein NC653_022277 [Populus alba x Populus x berolinensis]|uniref:Uncharacterized protein n=1 Tax=Populus alba x Populus x berolinensis TaxID=444605 RepID=A0AAD6MEE6_9ROSI|nr:hypothetical protein NC653_022277 [Populus alba x Populus x berolinensis]
MASSDPSRPATGYPFCPQRHQLPTTATRNRLSLPSTHHHNPLNPYYYNTNQPYPNQRATLLRRLIAALIIVTVIFFTILFIIWLVIRPHLPEFRVHFPLCLQLQCILFLLQCNWAKRNVTDINAEYGAMGSYIAGRAVNQINGDKGRGSQAITDPYSKVRALVRLSREDIKNLRERVLCQIEKLHVDTETRPMHLSSFVLAYAYVFVRVFKAKGLERDDKVVLGLTADCRARLGIPENYFGCCVMPFFVHIDPETIVQENGFLNVIERLSEIIVRLNKGVLDGAKEKFAEFMTIRPGTLMVTVSGSPQFQIYKADFGWGVPRKVETPSIDKTGSISMQENADGRGGIEIGLVLLKHEMEIFNSLFVDGLV